MPELMRMVYPTTSREYIVNSHSCSESLMSNPSIDMSLMSTTSIDQNQNLRSTKRKYKRNLMICSAVLILIFLCTLLQFFVLWFRIDHFAKNLSYYIKINDTNSSTVAARSANFQVTRKKKDEILEKQDKVLSPWHISHNLSSLGEFHSSWPFKNETKFIEGEISDTVQEFQEELEEIQFNQEITDDKINYLEDALNLTIQELKNSKTIHEHRLGIVLNLLKKVAMKQYGNDDSMELDEDWTVEAHDTNDDVDANSIEDLTCDIDKVAKVERDEVSCNASSKFTANMGCEKAFDGVLAIGRAGRSTWASKGEGVGAWIQATFLNVKIVKVVKILQRHSQLESIKNVELEFDGGTKQIAKLPAKGDHHWNVIKLTHGISTKAIKIKVLSIYKAVNVGFKEIEIYTC